MSDITQAKNLIEGKNGDYVLADKAYDADDFIAYIVEKNAEPIIPSRINRIEKREHDRHIYKNRNLIERFFNKLKQFRRVATRYEKTVVSFLAMVKLSSSMILMR